jgi:acyl-CoA thioesterase-2
MTADNESILHLLDLEPIEKDIFRGAGLATSWRRTFGGLVIAQAAVAAARTVEDRPIHSLHGYFILPGESTKPIVYQVERIRDGGSFSTRRCVAIQNGQTIFFLSASFHVPEESFSHQTVMPEAPDPDTLPSLQEIVQQYGQIIPKPVREYFDRGRPVELRPVDLGRYLPMKDGETRPAQQKAWLRASQKLPDDPAIHRAVLAYMSDMTLLDTSLVTHGTTVFDPAVQAASLDHALWFHRPFRADEWLLYVQDSPNANGALGLTRGGIFARNGDLVASVAQEGLIRRRRLAPHAQG